MLAVGDRIGPYRLIGDHPGGGFRGLAGRTRVWIEIGEVWRESVSQFLEVATLEHPGIAHIVERGVLPDHRPWIATELADGVPLSDIMARRTLAADEVVALIRDVASILVQLHDRGLVHDAIKPHVIVMRTGQRAFPIQLGGWSSLRTGNGSEDIHALGVLAYRAVTGRFPGLAVPELVPGVPGALSGLIVDMLAADPAERPDADAVLAEIASLAGDRSLAGPRFAKPSHAAPLRVRWTPPPEELQAVAEAITLPRKRV